VEGGVLGLVVEGDHLDAEGPKDDGVEVGRVDAHSRRVGAHQLRFGVRHEGEGLFAAQFLGHVLVEARALVAGVARVDALRHRRRLRSTARGHRVGRRQRRRLRAQRHRGRVRRACRRQRAHVGRGARH